jgi:HEAT repeat protein
MIACLFPCWCVLASAMWSDGMAAQQPATFGGRTVEQWAAILTEHVQGDRDEDKELSRQAASALGLIGPPAASAVKPLSQAVQSLSLEVRDHAVDALGRIGPGAAPAVPIIVAELDLPPDHINYVPLVPFRRVAARSLGRMGPAAQAAVPVLGRALKNEDPVYRVEAALALWRILQRPEAIDFLAEMIDPDESVGPYEALMALKEIGPGATGSCSASWPRWITLNPMCAAPLRMSWPLGTAVIEPVAQRIQQGSLRWPAPAAFALGEVAGPLRDTVFYRDGFGQAEFDAAAAPVVQFAAPALIQLLSDPRDMVRQTAQQSLSQWGLLAAGPCPGPAGQRRCEPPAGSGRRWCGSRRICRPPGVERTARCPETQPAGPAGPPDGASRPPGPYRGLPVVRVDVLRPAGPRGLPLLRRALKDENLAVRRYAAQAIRNVGSED